MSSTEDRVRAATRASGATVHAIRPLSLPQPSSRRPAARSARRGRRWVLWMAPVTAAAAVTAIALSLATIRPFPNDSGLSRSRPAASAPAPAQDSPADVVPGYYVTVGQHPGASLTVRNSFTGAVVTQVSPPRGTQFVTVGGSEDDRTFVVTAIPDPPTPAWSHTWWYLLRLTPGGASPARLTKLPVPVTPNPTGYALSPDGRELAMAVPGPSGQELRLYAVTSGALLRTWSSPADAGQIGAYPSPGASLAWLGGGKEIAFVYGGKASSGSKFNWTGAIRVLDVTKPGGSLTANAAVRLNLAPAPTPEGYVFSCDVLDGWAISAHGTTVACAGVDGALLPPPADTTPLWSGRNCGKLPPAGVGFTQVVSLPSGGGEVRTPYQAFTCSASTASVYQAWSDPSGSVVIGSVSYGTHRLFGVFRGKSFTPLHATPPGIPLSSIAW